MEKWIKNIKGIIPYTNKTVDIELNGKNLIVAGANGSGKTSFLRTLYELLVIQWNKTTNRVMPTISNYGLLLNLLKEKKAILKFYEEKRLSEIKQPQIGQQINAGENKLGNELEQHLLNLISRQSFAISMEKNQKLADDIQNWFNDFESKLKILFEDESLTLKFDPDTSHFSIIQKNKPPFTFQTLSAGYRAIFDIYADLLMHTEYFKIMPNELTGIVFIDEIDSHLHVSLQRLILPFFTQSFPKIQFIVTTHSPFVLMSTPDTIIFDLGKNEPVTEDLSYYTYSAVMEGLWDVKPIAEWVERKINEIGKIINSENKDISQLKKLIDEIKGREDGLDSESKAIYLLGKQILLKKEAYV
jgi:AAA15 family ATPase/GTPase